MYGSSDIGAMQVRVEETGRTTTIDALGGSRAFENAARATYSKRESSKADSTRISATNLPRSYVSARETSKATTTYSAKSAAESNIYRAPASVPPPSIRPPASLPPPKAPSRLPPSSISNSSKGAGAAPLIGQRTRKNLMLEENERIGTNSHALSEGGMRLVEWYVRIDRKKIFGPFTKARMERFVQARKEKARSGTTEIRRGTVESWHLASSGRDFVRRDSAHGSWSSRADQEAASRQRLEKERSMLARNTEALNAIRGRLDHVNAEHAARDRKEKARLEEAARTRRAGAHMLAKKWNLPESMILPKTVSHNSFETRAFASESQ